MKVIVGISGGVDSSVAALILKKQGYTVEALFMKNWNEETAEGRCSWENDVEDALQVCEKLEIPLNTIDLSFEYWEGVFKSFIDDYRSGLTPNPDVLCNQEVKFKAFMEHALGLGADKIATGHYARIIESAGRYSLHKAADTNKDQTYFLSRLDQNQLSKTLFPLGDLLKSEVRRIAAGEGLATHDKKDSTGICFIGERPFREFLGQYIPVRKGTIQTSDGRVVGSHDGVFFYTLGQRQGLGIGGIQGAEEAPWYVTGKDMDKNIIFVSQGHDNPLLYSRNLAASGLHWIEDAPADIPYKCSAKTRYRQPDQHCSIVEIDDGKGIIHFDIPQRAVTPGQYIVFYKDDVCLGSGVIESTWNQAGY